MKPIYKFTPKQIAFLKENGFEVSKSTINLAVCRDCMSEEIRVGQDGFFHINIIYFGGAVTYKTFHANIGITLEEAFQELGHMRKQAIKDLEETIRTIRKAYYL